MDDKSKMRHKLEVTIFLFFIVIVFLIVWIGVLYSKAETLEQNLADLEVLCEMEKDVIQENWMGKRGI